MSERIVIFGHEGRWGKVLDKGAQSLGHETRGIEKDATHQEKIDAVNWATVLGFAVWPKALSELIDELEDEIEGKVVFDIAGRKNEIIPSLERLSEKGNSVVSTHPKISEKTPLRGEEVMVMPVGENSDRAVEFVEDFFSALRMIPVRHNIETHDKDMGPEQGFPHAMQRAIGSAINSEGIDPKHLWDLAPANAKLTWLAMYRTANQPPEISAQAVDSFLRSEQGLRMLLEVADNLAKMVQIVEENDSETAQQLLAQLFDENSGNLKSNPISKEMQETTTIIVERLANLRLHSITVHSAQDIPGVLHKLSGVFAKHNINMTAVDSHDPGDGGIKFAIGDEATEEQIATAIPELEKEGFKVLEVKNRNPQ